MSPINCCLLLVMAVVWLAPIQPSLAGQDITQKTREAYERMEKCLAKRWKDANSLDENMQQVDKCASLSIVNVWTGENRLKEVGVKLMELTTLTDDNNDDESMCFYSGYDILKEHLEYSRGLAHLMKLIEGFIARNGEYCEQIFASLAQRPGKDGLGSSDRKTFENFTSNLLEEVSGMSEQKLEPFLREAIEMNSINLRDYIKETFGARKESVDFKSLLHKMALGANPYGDHLYQKYIDAYRGSRFSAKPDDFTGTIIRWLVEPCADFVNAMDNRKVFQMASLQSKVLQRNFKFVPYSNKHIKTNIFDLVDFYKNWIRYESCKTYALADDIFKQVQETRKMVLGDHDDRHTVQHIGVKLPDATIVKLDELIE